MYLSIYLVQEWERREGMAIADGNVIEKEKDIPVHLYVLYTSART